MDKKECKVSECYKEHACKIFGVIFLLLGTILTLITLNGAGILGMFIVGAFFCCKSHCKKACPCSCPCCKSSCDSSTVESCGVDKAKK